MDAVEGLLISQSPTLQMQLHLLIQIRIIQVQAALPLISLHKKLTDLPFKMIFQVVVSLLPLMVHWLLCTYIHIIGVVLTMLQLEVTI